MRNTRTRTSLALLLTGALLAACSSAGDDVAGKPPAPSPETMPDDDDVPVARSNTGLPGAPRGGAAITSPRPETIDLDYLTAGNGHSFSPELGESEWTRAFSGLGDIDGDGMDDFAFSTSERTYVLFGDGSRLPETLELDALFSEVRGFVLETGLPELAGVGDVNGDGIGDLAWLVHDEQNGGQGARVVFGRADGELDRLTDLPADGVGGFALVDSARPFDVRSIGAAGDIDGDGRDDILIGAFARNGEDYDAPNAWVIYGRPSGFPATVDVARLDANEGLVLTSPLDAAQRAAVYDDIGTGFNASAVGDFDFNGDGLDDVAIGSSHFDWIAQSGMLRTYVVFGSATRPGRLDMTMLDGSDGVLIAGAPSSDGSGSDLVASLGDVNGDGVDDLALIDAMSTGDEAHVIFGSSNGFGAFIERASLPAGAGFAIGDSSGGNGLRGLARTGDVDGDGVNDIGIEYRDGAAILYGGTWPTSTALDLSNSGEADISMLDGSDDGDLVALGDIDSDGVDDLGIGWSSRAYDTGIVDIGDIDGDGVADVGIGPSDTAFLSFLRVLYGFGPDGFTGVLPDPSGPQPLKRIEEGYYAELLAAIERAAQAPLDYLNAALANGTPLGPVATACLTGSDGIATATVGSFACAGEPLSFTFDWDGGRYRGTAGGRYAVVDTDAEGLRTIDYESFPPAGLAPGGNPYQAYFSFERGNRLALSGTALAGPEGSVEAPTCVVDTTTRVTTSETDVCTWRFRQHLFALNAIFGERREVGELRFESALP